MSVTISFFGDFVAVNPQKISFSEEVQQLLDGSDINVCNFEAPIDGNFKAFDREGPRVKQSPESPKLLMEHGFNVFQLANNHMCDFGEEGCLATINALKDAITVGAGTLEEAYRVVVKEVNGKKIGFLALVHHEFGVLEGLDSPDAVGTAWICHNKVGQIISDAKKAVDFLFVLPHAGIELVDAPLPEWRSLYKHFIDLGADGVIGTHPHVPQGWESYKGKPICYSLGNFYFDAITCSHPYWNKSLVAQIEINDCKDVKLKVVNIVNDEGKIDIDASEATLLHNGEICSLLQNSETYSNYIDQISFKCWQEYQVWMVRGLGAISAKLGFKESLKSIYCALFRPRAKSLLMNTMQCESHRWTILRAQKLS